MDRTRASGARNVGSIPAAGMRCLLKEFSHPDDVGVTTLVFHRFAPAAFDHVSQFFVQPHRAVICLEDLELEPVHFMLAGEFLRLLEKRCADAVPAMRGAYTHRDVGCFPYLAELSEHNGDVADQFNSFLRDQRVHALPVQERLRKREERGLLSVLSGGHQMLCFADDLLLQCKKGAEVLPSGWFYLEMHGMWIHNTTFAEREVDSNDNATSASAIMCI